MGDEVINRRVGSPRIEEYSSGSEGVGGGSSCQVGSKEYGGSEGIRSIKGIWWVGGGSGCQDVYRGSTRTL